MTGTLVSGLLGYAFHFIVSRQISVAQYGELQSLLSLSLIFGVFNSTLSYFTIRHTAVFAAHRDRTANLGFTAYLEKKVFKFATAILVLLILASPLLAFFLHFSSYAGFVVVSLATFLSTLTVTYSEILRGWEKFFWLTLVGIAAALVKFLSGAVLAVRFHHAAAVSFSFLLAAIVGWYLAKIWSKEKIAAGDGQKPAADWKNKYFSETNLRRTAAKIFFFSLALVLVSNLDVILVKYFASADIAGYFGAFNLLGKIVLWLNTAVVAVVLPGACADGHSGKRFDKKNLLGSYGLLTFVGLGSMAVFFLAPDFVIKLFFGNKYIFDTQILWLFALIAYLLSVLTLEANLSFAKRDFRVVYFLGATLLLMVVSIAKYHNDLTQIVLALSVSFLMGYISTAILNLSQEKHQTASAN